MTIINDRGRRLTGWASNMVYDGPIVYSGRQEDELGMASDCGNRSGRPMFLTAHWLGVGAGECRRLWAGSGLVDIQAGLGDLGAAIWRRVRLDQRICRSVTGGVRIELTGTVIGAVRRIKTRK